MSENEKPDINELYNQEADIHRSIPEHEENTLYNGIDRLSSSLDKEKKPEKPQQRPHYPNDDIAPRLSE